MNVSEDEHKHSPPIGIVDEFSSVTEVIGLGTMPVYFLTEYTGRGLRKPFHIALNPSCERDVSKDERKHSPPQHSGFPWVLFFVYAAQILTHRRRRKHRPGQSVADRRYKVLKSPCHFVVVDDKMNRRELVL